MSNIELVDFYGDKLEAVRDGSSVRVVLKPMCVGLGIDPEPQRKKLASSGWATTSVTEAVGADGRSRVMFTIALDDVPMWLATIPVSRVSEEARPMLLRYQRECARVLRDHFFGAPRPQQIDASVSNGVRMGDTSEGRHEVQTRCLATARACQLSRARIYGIVRRSTRVGSPFFVSALDWQLRIRPMLDDLACGRLLLPAGKPRKQRPTNRRQRDLFGEN